MIHTFMPIVLMSVVLAAILCQKIGRWVLPVWLITLCAAGMLIITGQLSLIKALQSIDTKVIFYLLGLFIITQSLEQSHMLAKANLFVFSRIKSMNGLVLFLIFSSGISAAFLMNDTIAVVGVPVIFLLARQQQIDHRPLLITLALSITLGSVFSPTGNPQNMMIASHGMEHPFSIFFSHLLVPGLLSLIVLYLGVRLYYRNFFKQPLSPWTPHFPVDKRNAWPGILAILLLVLLIIFIECYPYRMQALHLNLGTAALLACLPIVLFSRQRFRLVASIDWRTLCYFIGLFILMAGVYQSSLFQHMINNYKTSLHHQSTILTTSLLVSQLTSNIPLVLLYLPQLQTGNIQELLNLAIGSTLAGNLLVTGAASNIIVVQSIQQRKAKLFSFWTFSLLGVPVTLVSLLIYYVATLSW